MPQPQPQAQPTSPSLSSLTHTTPPSVFLSTITNVLTSWQSGLLSHTHPTKVSTLPQTFLNLLSTLQHHPWQTLDPSLIQFLQTILLKKLIESPQIYHQSLPGVLTLLKLHKPTRAVLASAVFLVMRICNPGGLCDLIFRDAPREDVLSTHISRLLPLVSNALTEDASTLVPDVKPAKEILHGLLTTCTQAALRKHVMTIREMLYPLLEHPSVDTRLPGVAMFNILSERCGVVPGSVEYLKTSLLWNDPGTALISIPLIITHLAYLDFGERVVVEKRILECLITLSTAYKDRYPCVESTLAVIELLPCMDGLVSCNGERYLSAMGAFLGRVGGMVTGGSLEKGCVVSLCEAVVKGVRRWWIGCNGFRTHVFKGCLICFMEIDDVVVTSAVKDVVLTLAKCHPGRMRRLVQDVRESVRGFTGMGRVVSFLEEVENEFVDVKEMRRVDTGRLIERFFPEVNEFNLN